MCYAVPMPAFSEKSKARLATCHPDLQRLFNAVIEKADCTVLCGHRGKEEQDEAYANGYSAAKWGQSKHNSLPSLAVDVAPYPVNWSSLKSWRAFAEIVKAEASRLGIKVVHGGDWKMGDFPHWELSG